MKILILNGSGRKRGNTAQITGLVAAALSRQAAKHGADLECETVFLSEMKLEACRGCRVCFDRGEEKCPARDNFLELKAKMQAADGLVVATPVYVDDVSGLTKTWIDRLAHVCHRPEFAGKCALMLATTGSSPVGHTLGTLSTALSTWGFHITGQAGFKMGALMHPDEAARFSERAEQAAGRLFAAIHGRTFERPGFRSLMTFKIQQIAWQRSQEANYDKVYWQRQGWLNPACEFYHPHQAARVKVALARAAGAALARFVL